MLDQLVADPICAGTSLRPIVPSPSWPESFRPEANSVPFEGWVIGERIGFQTLEDLARPLYHGLLTPM